MKRLFGFSLKLMFVVGLVAVLYLAYTAWDVWSSSHRDEAQQADAIVVLGAAQYNGYPSPVLKARLDHAADLRKRGFADTIVVTGGKGEGDRNSEAGASAAYLATLGVPDRAVLREVQGRSSWESLQAAAAFMKKRDINRVILVSDPFHTARIREMARDLGLDPVVSPTRTSPIGGSEELRHYAKEIAGLGLGRLVGFSRIAGIEDDFAAAR